MLPKTRWRVFRPHFPTAPRPATLDPAPIAPFAEVEQGIREAIELHIAGLREDGQPIPLPSSEVEYVDIAV